MPYALTDFNGVPLPQAMPSDDLSTGRTDSTLNNSIGGVFDSYGANRRYPGVHRFLHKGKYEGKTSAGYIRVTVDDDIRLTKSGDTRVVAYQPLLELQTQTDALKALIGVRGPLWRRRYSDDARQWKTCRLLEVQHVETVAQAGVVSDVQSSYETAMNGWHAEAATVVSGSASAGVALPLTAANAGLLPICDAVLTITGTSGTITQIIVGGGGVGITWTGSLLPGQVLQIDAGNRTVTKDNNDSYSGFSLAANVQEWLALGVGTSYLAVTLTGGNGAVSLSYYNQWP